MNDLSLRVLQFSGDGRLITSLKGLKRSERALFPHRSATTDASVYIHEMFASLRRQRPRHLVVFTHGGLVSFKAGMGRVVAIEQDERLKLWSASADTAFLYLNWNAGLLSTYGEHLVTNQGQVLPVRSFFEHGFSGFRRGMGLVAGNLLADVGRGVTRFPLNAKQYASDAPRMWPLATGNPATFYRFEPGLLLLDPASNNEPVDAVNLQSDNLLRAFIARPATAMPLSMDSALGNTSPFYNHFTQSMKWLPARAATVLLGEVIGRPAWRSMLRRTQTMYHRPMPRAALQPDSATSADKQLALRDAVQRASRREETVPYLFHPGLMLEFADSLEAYRQWRSRQPDATWASPLPTSPAHLGSSGKQKLRPQRPTITLIGHSMGAIVMSQLLEERRDQLQVDHIVYMAAACNLQDFRYKVVPYLQQRPQTLFYNLTLHPYSEVNENMLQGVLPAHFPPLRVPVDGSLLVAIDRLLIDPLTPMERTLGRWHNFVLATFDPGFVPEPMRRRVTLKAFGFGPSGSFGPQYHGDFDNVRLPKKGLPVYPHALWSREFREARIPSPK
ncbi:hypothetical protein [Hymenobacter koreensis]|uniref:Alpha/beta hydrolase n=1 Tax=Hymenobacter koreensis TaxID=1084523 RepID=A0ABP8IY15_9BACT